MKAVTPVPQWERGRLTEADYSPAKAIETIDGAMAYIEKQEAQIIVLRKQVANLKELVFHMMKDKNKSPKH